jgi:hypothetical protein
MKGEDIVHATGNSELKSDFTFECKQRLAKGDNALYSRQFQ